MRIRRAAARCAATMVLSGLLGAPASAATTDKDAVLNASASFYAALNKLFLGEVAPMEAVWSHADDVTYMGPGGAFDIGWSATLKDWQSQAAMKLGGKVEPTDIHVVVGGDLAIVDDYEQGENVADGKVQRLKLRATSLYRKENGHWKMIGHHTDTLPYIAK